MPVHLAGGGFVEPVRVMLVDDSAVARAMLVGVLDEDPLLRVIGHAADGREALALLPRLRPEIVLLDLEMPAMSGLDALPRLLDVAPSLAVVVVSGLTRCGAETTLLALRLGAVDYVTKPGADPRERSAFKRELAMKLHGLAARRRRPVPGPLPPWRLAASPDRATGALAAGRDTVPRGVPARVPALVAVGSSTGGPQALFTLAAAIGRDLPVPVVVVQHMPATFTAILAAHLDRLNALPCSEAVDGEPLRAGHLYIAAGSQHLAVDRDPRKSTGPADLRARLSDADAVNFCRPSVDVLLRSAALACDGRVLVVMLTGMGQDGLAGTREVVAAGGAALAQDEATSVVWGMPGAIAQAGLCRAVLPLGEIGGRVRLMVSGGAGPRL